MNDTFRGNRSTFTIVTNFDGKLVVIAFDTEYPSGLGTANPFFTRVAVYEVLIGSYMVK